MTTEPTAVWTRQELCVYEKLMEICHMTQENWRPVCATVGNTIISYLWSSSERWPVCHLWTQKTGMKKEVSPLKGHGNSVCLTDSAHNRGTLRKWQNNAVPRHKTTTDLQPGWCTAINQPWSAHTYRRRRVCAARYHGMRVDSRLESDGEPRRHLWQPCLPKLHTYLLPYTAHPVEIGRHRGQQTSTWHKLTPIVRADSPNKWCKMCAFTVKTVIITSPRQNLFLSTQKVWKTGVSFEAWWLLTDIFNLKYVHIAPGGDLTYISTDTSYTTLTNQICCEVCIKCIYTDRLHFSTHIF